MRNKKTKKSQVVRIKAKAIYPDKLRLDVTSTLGIHVFSLAMQGDQVEYILPREKKHYSGPSGARALRPILQLPIDPLLFQNMLFQKPVERKDWSCTTDGEILKNCKKPLWAMTVEWQPPTKEGRLVRIDSRSASIQLHLDEYQSKFEEKQSTFQLKVPKKFKKYKL